MAGIRVGGWVGVFLGGEGETGEVPLFGGHRRGIRRREDLSHGYEVRLFVELTDSKVGKSVERCFSIFRSCECCLGQKGGL